MRIEYLVYNRGYRVDENGVLTNPKGKEIYGKGCLTT